MDVALCPQGLMDLNWLAQACGVYKPLPAQLQEELEAKLAAGLTVFPNTADTWGLAGVRRINWHYALQLHYMTSLMHRPEVSAVLVSCGSAFACATESSRELLRAHK